jgi:hypothetical protein
MVRESALHLTALSYSDSELLEQVIDKWLKTDLEFDFKRELASVKTIFDMKHQGKVNISEQVRYIADKIERPAPIDPMPENVYSDKQKRIEYCSTGKYKNNLEEFGEFIRSEKGIMEAGLELALEHLGREAVEHIIDYVKNNKMDRAKADQLMVIASEIMGDYVNKTRKLTSEDQKVIEEIQKYSEGMENQGVFDREDRVNGNLNRIKELLK